MILEQLTEHIWILPFNQETDLPNLGLIVGNDQTVIVDTGCGPSTVKALEAGTKEAGIPMPDTAVITHYHWDHSFGADYLNVTAYASAFTNQKMQEIIDQNPQTVDDLISNTLMPEFCREHIGMEFPDVSKIRLRIPELRVDTEQSIDLGGLTLQLIPVISSHTEGSLLAYCPEDQVLFIGDADCGYIEGVEFIDDFPKLEAFAKVVEQIDCRYIVEGHTTVYTKGEFLNTVNDRINL